MKCRVFSIWLDEYFSFDLQFLLKALAFWSLTDWMQLSSLDWRFSVGELICLFFLLFLDTRQETYGLSFSSVSQAYSIISKISAHVGSRVSYCLCFRLSCQSFILDFIKEGCIYMKAIINELVSLNIYNMNYMNCKRLGFLSNGN